MPDWIQAMIDAGQFHEVELGLRGWGLAVRPVPAISLRCPDLEARAA